jgi:1,4-alpha-glucan branching enzyme
LASGSQLSQAHLIKQTKRELRMKKAAIDKSSVPTTVPFSFAAPRARQVSLAGDFNNWNPEL